MGQAKNEYLVGVQYDNDKNVVALFQVISINKNTFNSLKNKYIEYLERELFDKQVLMNRITNLENRVFELIEEIRILKGEE